MQRQPSNPQDWPRTTIVTADGYRTIEPKPTSEQLKAYYQDRYFALGRANSQYAYEYTAEELEHKYVSPKECERLVRRAGSLFEVGVGEGFWLDHFARLGWTVRGVDFTDEGLKRFFPDLSSRIEVGDAFELLDREITSGRKHELVICNNVLEHVRDPERLLRDLKQIVARNGICRIVVPNDGSWLQEEAIKRGNAAPDFYVTSPEHLSYFTVDSLRRLLTRMGFEIVEMLGDFPIDIFLLNPDTAYTKEKLKGRNCHFARVAFELALARRSIDDLIAFRRTCAEVGLGRALVAYVAPRA